MLAALRYWYLAYFSQPVADRRLYRLVRRHRIKRILELGVGNLTRAMRLVELAGQIAGSDVRYTGIDLFELRPGEAGCQLSLKEAHRRLSTAGVKPRLVPGDPHAALARVANNLFGQDLVIVSADQQGEALEAAWFYFPRLLHGGTVVMVEEPGDAGRGGYRQLSAADIERLANSGRRRAA